MNTLDLVWAAGFFEGEGCFTSQMLRGHYRVSTRISNADLEVLTRFHDAVEVGRLNGPYDRGPNKPLWMWQATGYAQVSEVAAKMWPWLGTRRKERALEVLGSNLQLTA